MSENTTYRAQLAALRFQLAVIRQFLADFIADPRPENDPQHKWNAMRHLRAADRLLEEIPPEAL